jgi:hypothetical protein
VSIQKKKANQILIFCGFTKAFDDDYHLLGDDNHHSHRRGNLKSHKAFDVINQECSALQIKYIWD